MNKEEAAQSLGVSVRSFQRYCVTAGVKAIQTKINGRYTADYTDEDLKKIEKAVSGFPSNGNGSTASTALESVNRPQADSVSPNAIAARLTPAGLVAAIASAVEKAVTRDRFQVDLKDKWVLTLKEASRLSGIPARRLVKSRRKNGHAVFVKDSLALGRGWRCKRYWLEEYCGEIEIE